MRTVAAEEKPADQGYQQRVVVLSKTELEIEPDSPRRATPGVEEFGLPGHPR